jgi:gliding motility-associated-like protein
MKRVFILSLLLTAPWLSWATHIVGGELNLQYTNQSYRYILSLNLYFDDINGEREAEDEQIFVALFSKRTNRQVTTFTLRKSSSAQINYTNAACSNNRLQTRQIRYSDEIFLEPNIFNESEGYYISWERCCRNDKITNIINPVDNGIVFYLEFPAVTQNGNRLINSSPAFSMPEGDYACVNEQFYFDFGATDADGDELKYSLITPKRGSSSRISPFGSGPNPGSRGIFYPQPYPTIDWSTGFSLSNVMGGPKSLQVNATTGQLSFVANRLGLYVFSVLCEEYRNGVKIGAVQRDFQLLLTDCKKNDPPVIQARDENTIFFYEEGNILTLSYDEQPCLDIFISDPNTSSTASLKVNALNFSSTDITVSPTYGFLSTTTDTLRAQVCFNSCIPHTRDQPLLLQIIASDNGCPIPKRDTMLIKVYIETVATASPDVTTSLTNNAITMPVGLSIQFDVMAVDPDNDAIKLYAIGEDFSLADLGMEFTNSSGTGKITKTFSWTPSCEVVENTSMFTVNFITEDNSCSPNRFDTVKVNLYIEDFAAVMSKFSPPNVFTPNNDGVNDYFQIANLPPDDCEHVFKGIEIYNRWGKSVYIAKEREFQWSGLDFPAGTYYYLINYGASTIKGTVSLLR